MRCQHVSVDFASDETDHAEDFAAREVESEIG